MNNSVKKRAVRLKCVLDQNPNLMSVIRVFFSSLLLIDNLECQINVFIHFDLYLCVTCTQTNPVPDKPSGRKSSLEIRKFTERERKWKKCAEEQKLKFYG